MGDAGSRRLCCPDELSLCASWERDEPKHRAGIDLLELLTVPGREDCAFGLIHLSLEPEDEDTDPLWWTWAIRSKFRRSTVEYPHLQLCQGEECTDLKGRTPLRELIELTLGPPRADFEQQLFTAVMAPCPAGCDDDEQAEWRRAIAKRAWTFPLDEDRRQSDPSEEEEQTVRLGKVTALVRRDAAVLTNAGPITKGDARNFRSYWSESLVAGLVQHDCLESFQGRLAGIGRPVKPDIEPLYDAWLDFRNLVWWSQLSTATPVPQKLLTRLRAVRGTERLFTDLEGDLATYSAQRRSIVEDAQAAALRNFQVGGAGIAILAPLLAIVALTDAHGAELRNMIIGSVLVAALVAIFAYLPLRPRSRRADA